MRKLKESWASKAGAARMTLLIPAIIAVAACSGSDHAQSPANTDELSHQSAAALLGSVKIQVSPALSPSFDPSIYDYVINCAGNPSVQFGASVPATGSLEFIGSSSGTAAPSYAVGNFQTAFALTPGQRFQFAVSFPQATSVYSVRCVPADFPPLSVTTGGTRQGEWYVFTPTISFAAAGAPSSYVIITDANGTPVWWETESSGPAMDAKILDPTDIAWTTLGATKFVVRAFDGRITNVLSGNLDAHELQPTSSGTYLAIRDVTRACPPDCADMSPWGGSAQAAVIDAEIVELDKSSKVLWTWRTRDHIALAETGGSGWFPSVGNDIIHMNAIQPDGTDGVIFSARHLNAIFHITKSTGAVDWKIGGTPRPESLTVIGDVRPTAIGVNGQVLSGQHDVRKWPDGTVSVHDNGTIANRPPFVVRYQIDTAERTATVVEEFTDARVSASSCCGSARRLAGGHWLVEWGASPFLTELDAEGNPVLTIQYNMGDTFSYRAVPILPGTVSASTLRSGMDAVARSGFSTSAVEKPAIRRPASIDDL